ncbi:hypothetical protein CHS0354_032925 [Potamilus streckersoni]|uniref:Uncharacterized protein n=1 Tax=Potamilus streckersoni TaxID=2493646 RepID=A0AAE0RWR2_9BIVA|nr:hypothetical protein CHS0354_032925 [Potamilus streckersoni]
MREAAFNVRTDRKWMRQRLLKRQNGERHRDKKRDMVQNEVLLTEEEERQVTAVGIRKKIDKMCWEAAISMKLSWSNIWRADAQTISFFLCLVHDILNKPQDTDKN